MQGDTAAAQEWLDRHRQLDIAHWPGNYAVGIGAHVAAGLLALDRLDLVAVRCELDHVGDGSSLFELWPFVAHLYAQHALYCGRAGEALAHLDRLQASSVARHKDDGQAEGDRFSRGVAGVLMSRARADLLIACGQGEKAKRFVRAQADKPWSRVPAVRLRLLSGHDCGAAIDALTWGPALSVRDNLELLLLGAVAARRRGDSRRPTPGGPGPRPLRENGHILARSRPSRPLTERRFSRSPTGASTLTTLRSWPTRPRFIPSISQSSS